MNRSLLLFFAVLLAVIGSAGCGGGGVQQSVAPPEYGNSSAETGSEGPVVGLDRAFYSTRPGEPTGSRHHGVLFEAGMFEQLEDAQLVYDLRLERAASVLVEVLEDSKELDSVTIRHALWLSGIPETSAATASLTAPTRDNALAKVLDWSAEKSLEGCTRIGLDTRPIPGGWQAVVIALPSLIEMDSFPRTMPEPGATELRFEVADGYWDAVVVMTAPDGRTIERRPAGEGSPSVVLELGALGVWQLEVVARSNSGPIPLAIFPLAVGVPHRVRLGGSRYDLDRREVAELEEELYLHVDEARRQRGLGALERDEGLSDVARAYSEEMSETGEVAHVSVISGDVADRVNRTGMQHPSLAENLGRGMSPREVHLGLMSSPAHRGAILEPTAYKVGIGVALDRSRLSTSMLVTQIFALRAQEVDTDAAQREIRGAINRARRAAGMKELRLDQTLTQDARRRAPVCFGNEADVELDWEGSPYESVISIIWKWPGGRPVSEDDVLPFQDPSFVALGVHVTQGTDTQMGADTVCAVILVGVKR